MQEISVSRPTESKWVFVGQALFLPIILPARTAVELVEVLETLLEEAAVAMRQVMATWELFLM